MENDRANRFEEMRQRMRDIERKAAADAKGEARAEARQLAEQYEGEATEVEATDSELAAELRRDAAIYLDLARGSDEASAFAQEMVEDAEPSGPDSNREEGGEA